MENEAKIKNRGWIKNAAIIFLTVMLVLTFFSNTILNWSLPEVSGQYAGYGQIKTSVTGTGTVKANMNYNVVLEETRKIESVLVKAGDIIVPGQTLFTLEDYENTELDQAEQSLEEMEFNYQMKILGKTDDTETQSNLEELYETLKELKEDRVEAVKNTDLVKGSEELVKIYQNERDKYTQSVSELEQQVSELTNGEAADSAELAAKLEELEVAKKNLEAAEEILAEKNDIYEEISGSIDLSYSAALSAYESAKKAYDDAYTELEYMQEDYDALVNSSESYEKLLKKYQEAEKELEESKSMLEAAQSEYESAKTAAQNAYSGNIDSDSEYNKLVEDQKIYDAALKEYNEALASGDPDRIQSAKDALDALTDYSKEISALNAYRNAKSSKEEASDAVDIAQADFDEAKKNLENASSATDSEITTAKRNLDRQKQTVSEYSKALAKARTELNEATTDDNRLKEAKDAVTAAEQSVKAYKKESETIQKELDSLLSDETKRVNALLKEENEKLKAVTLKYDEENKKLAELQSKVTETPDQIDEQIKTTEKQIETAEKEAIKQEEQGNKEDMIFNLELERDLAAIEKQREKVEKLREKTYDMEVVSKFDGTIAAVNVYSGSTVNAGDILAEIEIAGKGYTLEIPVTTEQSRAIAVGDRVTVDGYWWANELKLTVSAIKPDTSKPNEGKIVEIDIDGEVTNGQTLNVSIGERQSSYNLVVPNSAIREDADGKYILIASAKSTPLGSRYIAKRIPVTVLAKDNINSAVDAGSDYGYEYVISSSTAPIEDGSQVRLVKS